MNIKMLGVAIMVAIAVSGCKKVASDEQIALTDNAASQKAQEWFEKQSKQPADSQTSQAVIPRFNDITPEWNKTQYYVIANKLVSPVSIGNNFAKFLVLEQNTAGEIQNGYYCFVLSKENKNEVTSALLVDNSTPISFTGAIVKYRLDGTLLSAKHYEKGIVANTQDKLTVKKSEKVNDTGNTQSLAPISCNGQPYCIDWYWQTYVNGILIGEEYLYTSCGCQEAGGGGGAVLTCEQKLALFDAQGHAVNGPITSIGATGNNSHMDIPYNWLIFSAGPWGILSYEKGTVEKVHYPNITRWEYTSFTHVTLKDAGATLPGGSRAYEFSDATINISPTRTSVYERIDFKVTSSTCGISIAHPFNSNTIFHAPNSFETVPDL